jgi:hypothetical protein
LSPAGLTPRPPGESLEFRDKDFAGQEVLLDGNTFTGCTFRSCRVIFRGEKPFTLAACRFKDDARWAFDGPAALTLQALATLYKDCGDAGKQIVEYTLNKIVRGGK